MPRLSPVAFLTDLVPPCSHHCWTTQSSPKKLGLCLFSLPQILFFLCCPLVSDLTMSFLGELDKARLEKPLVNPEPPVLCTIWHLTQQVAASFLLLLGFSPLKDGKYLWTLFFLKALICEIMTRCILGTILIINKLKRASSILICLEINCRETLWSQGALNFSLDIWYLNGTIGLTNACI